MPFTVLTFSSSSTSINKKYFPPAREIGKYIGEKGWRLVYGGTDLSLMREIAGAALRSGAEVIGILPSIFARYIDPDSGIKYIAVGSMAERKEKMRRMSHAVVVFPGGFGTLDEFFDTLALKILGYIDHPICLFNFGNYYDKLLDFLEYLMDEGFADRSVLKYFIVAEKTEDVKRFLNGAYDRYLRRYSG